MAGDWIKFELTTPDKPEVVRMATLLRMDQDMVVGKLFRIWAWADQNTVDGEAMVITRGFVDRLTSRRGFAAAMLAVGWLVGQDGKLSFPNFGRHNGVTAKARAETNRRVRNYRERRAKLGGGQKARGGAAEKGSGNEAGGERRAKVAVDGDGLGVGGMEGNGVGTGWRKYGKVVGGVGKELESGLRTGDGGVQDVIGGSHSLVSSDSGESRGGGEGAIGEQRLAPPPASVESVEEIGRVNGGRLVRMEGNVGEGQRGVEEVVARGAKTVALQDGVVMGGFDGETRGVALPTLEEVKAYALSMEVLEEAAECWWLDCVGRGISPRGFFVDRNGLEIRHWQSALRSFGRRWVANERSRRTAPARGREKERPRHDPKDREF